MDGKNSTIKQIAREKLLGRWSEHCSYAILLGGLELLAAWIVELFPLYGSTMSFLSGMIVAAILQVLMFLFYAGAMLHFLKTLRGEPSPMTDFVAPLRNQADRYLVVGLIEVAAGIVLLIPIFAADALSGGNLFAARIFALVWLIVGGIAYLVFLANFALAIFILLDDPAISSLDAMRKSAKKMRGKKGKFILLVLSFAGYGLLVICSFGLGLVWVMPYFLTSIANFYETVK